jgi:hypothetical protein
MELSWRNEVAQHNRRGYYPGIDGRERSQVWLDDWRARSR